MLPNSIDPRLKSYFLIQILALFGDASKFDMYYVDPLFQTRAFGKTFFVNRLDAPPICLSRSYHGQLRLGLAGSNNSKQYAKAIFKYVTARGLRGKWGGNRKRHAPASTSPLGDVWGDVGARQCEWIVRK